MIDFSDDALYFRPRRSRWPFTLGAIGAATLALAVACTHIPQLARIAPRAELVAAILLLPALASLAWHRQRAVLALLGTCAFAASRIYVAPFPVEVLALAGIAIVANLGDEVRGLAALAIAAALAPLRFDPATRTHVALALLADVSLIAAFVALAIRLPQLARQRQG